MKLILLVVMLTYTFGVSAQIRMENVYGGSGGYGGGGYSSHPNRPAWGDGFKRSKKENRDYIPPEERVYANPTKSQDILDFEVRAKDIESYNASQKIRIDSSRNRISRSMDRYLMRSEMLDIAAEANAEAKHRSWDYYNQEEASIYHKIADTMLDLATSTLPGVSWGRDLYEAISGYDLLTGTQLDTFSRAMAIIGSVTVGFGSKAGKALNILKPLWDNSKLLRGEYYKAAWTARKIFEGKPLSELKKSLEFFKENRKHINLPHNDESNSFVNLVHAFEKSKITVLEKDVTVYRYYKAEYSTPKGQWLTPHKTATPKKDLALKFDVDPEPAQWVIPKGTKVLEGKVAPLNGEPGGAYQYFVPNMELLK